jgi:hypothetical protein
LGRYYREGRRLRPDELVRKRSGHRDERALIMELMYRHGGGSQVEVTECLGGLDYTAVSHEKRKIRRKISESKKIKQWAKELEGMLAHSPRFDLSLIS